MCSLPISDSDDMSLFFFFKQKTAYEMRISDWSSDVCSSDLFFSLEMRDEDLGRRALAGKSGVSVSGIEEGTYDAFEWDELQAAQQIFLQSRMLVDDRPGIRVDQIRDRCIVLKRSRNLKAIVKIGRAHV